MTKKECSTKESLIATTVELLWERGYVGMSPKAILKHSGVGQGSMYHHFTGKAELARDAIERSAENLRSKAAEQLSVPGTALDKIASFLQRERDILRGCQIGRLTLDPEIIESDMLRQPLGAAFDSVRGMLAQVLADGVARQELVEGMDVDATAEAIMATLQGGYVLARAAKSEAPFHDAIQGLQALLKTMARG